MSVTVKDLFCGAGGSSLGATSVQGVELVMAANHWQTAIEVHQAHFPNARHDLADISQADPRRYPRTDILIASPECTNHSAARGISRKRQQADLFEAPDPAAERSRATMWDVGRFAEQMRYEAIIVENVVEATKWSGWDHWLGWLGALGYQHAVISANSMHFGVPQSRDRIYVVFWRKGLRPNLELELDAWCPRCAGWVAARQTWKPDRRVGRYRQQWRWACTTCWAEALPPTSPAAQIIDWGLPCPRFGDKPRAAATRARVRAGLERFGWLEPVITTGAGNVHERTPGNRAHSLAEPLPVVQTTATAALATPPGFVVERYGEGTERRVRGAGEPLSTVVASTMHHHLATPPAFLVQPAHQDHSLRAYPLDPPHPTVTASDDRHALVLRFRGGPGHYASSCQEAAEPLRTLTTGGDRGGMHDALLMRNNKGGAEMVTPVSEPARTLTSAGHQSLLVPYNRTGVARSVHEPAPTVRTHDGAALLSPDEVVDECGFRMLEPYEGARAMAFPDGYIPRSLPKRDQMKLAGNAVTPPVMTWIMGRVVRALEEAS